MSVEKIDISLLLENYQYMLQSRIIDHIEEQMTSSGEAFFHVSGAGHEASVVFNNCLIKEDWLHCHYRDKALMLARGISIEMFFLATLNKDASHSRGRQMNAHMSAREFNVLSLAGPVGNSALQSAGVAEMVKDNEKNPIVLCAMGDGTTQQGEVLEAIAHASRATLPVLFLIEDNELAISTRTKGRTFFSTPQQELDSYHGIPITHVDGGNAVTLSQVLPEIVGDMRRNRHPHIVRFKTKRLSHHTNADDQRVYREIEEITALTESHDPIQILRAWFIQHGVTEEKLIHIETTTRERVAAAAERARDGREPEPTYVAKKPLPPEVQAHAREYRGKSTVRLSSDNAVQFSDSDRLTMLEAIRASLRMHLANDERVVLFGEDIEDPKGDVFGITKGLSSAYPSRVKNSPLAEASIIGLSVGYALAGARPVAFLQFADFLPIAYNQIFAEMGSMYWRSDGKWNVPMIVMITCGAYRPGLGPFHASSLESIAAHTPGVDVFMPATAGDAAGLLNAAFKSERPTLFFYPKSCLNDRAQMTSVDIDKHIVPIGTARHVQTGDMLTFVGWGNTLQLCEKAAHSLKEHAVTSDVIDLRSIVPWDESLIVESVRKTRRLIIVHEDNHTAGMGAEIAATVCERIPAHVEVRRITRADTFVPFNFSNQIAVLPSYKRVLETAVALLHGSVRWQKEQAVVDGHGTIDAVGSSPSDESVTVVKWLLKAGDPFKKGDIIADMEADKASVELSAPDDGILTDILVDEGATAKIGDILAKYQQAGSQKVRKKQITKDNPGIPIMSNLSAAHIANKGSTKVAAGVSTVAQKVKIGLVDIKHATGNRTVSNSEIIDNIPQWTSKDIVRRTGIEERRWIGDGESALTLAVDSVRALMRDNNLRFDEIGLILCSTETPIFHTPSMATLIQDKIKGNRNGFLCPAYDINAACTGYIYTLQIAYDFLQSQPDSAVLLVTAEALSTKLNLKDPVTAPIFADAGTATLIVSEKFRLKYTSEVYRPVIGANGEDGSILKVPIPDKTYISMDGQRVFARAVRDMIASLQRACNNALINLADLSKIVAHQANQRILNAVSTRLKLKDGIMFSNIRKLGNTSSSTIPLCLSKIIKDLKKNDYIGLTAFGGGFTFGGAILRAN